MMQSCPYPVADLLPHKPPMVLLDAVLGWEDGKLDARVDIHVGSRFYEPDFGVPAHVGIEYMAQACGAYAGLEAKTCGQPVRLGFLLGTRRFHSKVTHFRSGERLLVTISQVLRESSMGVFDCRIIKDEDEIAMARLNVYQPEDVSSVLAGGTENTKA